MRHLITFFVLTWGILRVFRMSLQRQPGNNGPAPKPRPEARKIFTIQEILQELRAKKIIPSFEWETKIATAVAYQQSKKLELAKQSYAVLEKAQLEPNQPVVNLFKQSKKLNDNFALLQDALKKQGE